MKKLFLLSIKITLLLIPLWALMFAPAAQAQTTVWSGDCVGPAKLTTGNTTANSAGVVLPDTDASDVATIHGFGCLIGNVLMVALTGLGLIGFVSFVVGAFSYMLSGGNAKGTENAKNRITYAIIGLVVALSAFIILNLISNFTGIPSILNFTIPAVSNTPTP